MHSIISKFLDKYKKMSVQLKASFWFLICSFLQKGISVITTPIFTRLLTTAEYGQYTSFNSWLGIITVVVTLNLSYGVYAQGLVKFSDEKNVFSSSLQGLSLTLTIVWTIVYLLFKEFWNSIFDLTTVQMLAMLVMMWTSAVFNFWATEQRTQFKYKLLIAVSILVSILKPVIGIIFVINANDKITARILGLALVELICYFVFFVIQMKNGKQFYSNKYWKYALKFNIPLIPHYLSQTILSGADKIMIKKMCNDSQAGIYGLAVSISNVMTLFNTAMMQTLSPWIYQKIKDNKAKEIERISYITLVFIALVNILLIAFAPEAVRIFAPIEYYDAIYVIPPIAMSTYFMFAYDLFAKFEFYYEKTSWISFATVASAVINIISNYILIKLFGYKAAGYTTLLCYALYVIFHYIMMKRICKNFMNSQQVFDTRKILIITGLFMALGFIFLLLYKFIIIRYLLIFLIAIVIIIRRKDIICLIDTLFNINVKKKENA